MTKSQFKKAYSKYREELTEAYRKGRGEFSAAFDSNPMLGSIVCNKNCDRPVSIKCHMYLSGV